MIVGGGLQGGGHHYGGGHHHHHNHHGGGTGTSLVGPGGTNPRTPGVPPPGGQTACCACSTEADSAAMAFVGAGAGAYTTETTYRYVGAGAGEFDVVETVNKSKILCYAGCATLAVIVAVLIALLLILPVTPTTTAKAVGPPAHCLIWGDPHVKTFDRATTNFFDEGIYWIVKSPTVSIQARNLATPYTKGLAALHSIAFGGPFMAGHTVIVGPLQGGRILVDGAEQLRSFPSTLAVTAGIMLNYNGEGNLVDSSLSHLPKRIVHMDLPLGIHVVVFRWDNHINAKITMRPRVGGQDGMCGNFNGEANDDTFYAVMSRTGGAVLPSRSIFHHMVPPHQAPRHTLQECMQDQARYTDALKKCQAEAPSVTSADLVKGCVYDVCFAGPQYAAQDGMAESTYDT